MSVLRILLSIATMFIWLRQTAFRDTILPFLGVTALVLLTAINYYEEEKKECTLALALALAFPNTCMYACEVHLEWPMQQGPR